MPSGSRWSRKSSIPWTHVLFPNTVFVDCVLDAVGLFWFIFWCIRVCDLESSRLQYLKSMDSVPFLSLLACSYNNNNDRNIFILLNCLQSAVTNIKNDIVRWK